MAGEQPPAKNSLEILPLEVWSKIFDELDCPTDVASCYRTCRDWMTFLEPKRDHFLMPEVFPLIVKYLTVEEKVVDVDDDSFDVSEEDETPIPNPILSTRLVCKSWKYAADSFLQNHPHHTNVDFGQEKEHPDPRENINALPIKQYKFDVEVLDKLDTLVGTDFPPDCNPILTRYVKYYEYVSERPGDEANHFPRLRTAFTNLLELHGTQVWHASFSLDFPTIAKMHERRNVYNLIHRYLSLMPNLKTLHLQFSTGCNSFTLHKMTPTLEQLIVTNSLPTLEHLTSLQMAFVPAPLEKGLLLANSHVQKLFWLSNSFSTSSASLLNIRMNNLEEFTAHLNGKVDLRKLRSLSWPFKKLSIRTQHFLLDSAIRAISASHFANNLKHLVVRVFGDEDFHKLKGKLELPNLITFQIRAYHTPLKNIDFLLPTSTSLSSLQIEMNAEQEPTWSMTTRSMGTPTPNQVIQFDGYVPNMLESNIWNHFPKLKYLKIVKYNPNHVRDFSYTCCGGKPCHDHFKNEKHEYTRADWQNIVKNQLK